MGSSEIFDCVRQPTPPKSRPCSPSVFAPDFKRSMLDMSPTCRYNKLASAISQFQRMDIATGTVEPSDTFMTLKVLNETLVMQPERLAKLKMMSVLEECIKDMNTVSVIEIGVWVEVVKGSKLVCVDYVDVVDDSAIELVSTGKQCGIVTNGHVWVLYERIEDELEISREYRYSSVSELLFVVRAFISKRLE